MQSSSLIILITVWFLLFFLQFPGLSYAQPKDFTHALDKTCKVIKIKDGDTAVIKAENGKSFTCRLYGIDAS
jgi:endonuclease YncB( thermonuclease family)